MTETTHDIHPADVDRVRELTSIGAGHAANAFATMLGRTCRMRVPTVRLLSAERMDAPFVANSLDDERRGMVGVFFEVEGGLGGVVALLISTATRDRLLEHLIGGPPAHVPEQTAESALREVGNILVSHVVSAMADTLGVALLPSIPLLVLEDAPSAFASLVALREAERPALRVETEISDRLGEVRALLVFVPDRTSVIAAHEGF